MSVENISTQSSVGNQSWENHLLQGFYAIQSLVQTNELTPYVLMDEYDFQLAVLIFKNMYNKLPETDEDVYDQHVQFRLTVVKKNARRYFEDIIKSEFRKETISNFNKMSESHDLGTVSEISEKYGISKKKVRKMKAEGTLEEYINAL